MRANGERLILFNSEIVSPFGKAHLQKECYKINCKLTENIMKASTISKSNSVDSAVLVANGLEKSFIQNCVQYQIKINTNL